METDEEIKCNVPYQSKQQLASACSEIIEDLLRKTYDEENPFERFTEQLPQSYGPNTIENALSIEQRERLEDTSEYGALLDVQSQENLVSVKNYVSSVENTGDDTNFTSSGDACDHQSYISQCFKQMMSNRECDEKSGSSEEVMSIDNRSLEVLDSNTDLQSEIVESEKNMSGESPTPEEETAPQVIHEYPQLQQVEAYFINHSYRSPFIKTKPRLRAWNRETLETPDPVGNYHGDNSNVYLRHHGVLTLPPNYNEIVDNIYGQGDNENLEGLGQEIFEDDLDRYATNVEVTVSFSIYAKLLALAVTINMLLILKYVVFDVLMPVLIEVE